MSVSPNRLSARVLGQARIHFTFMLTKLMLPRDCFTLTEIRRSRQGQVLPSAVVDGIGRKGIEVVVVQLHSVAISQPKLCTAVAN